MSKIGKRESIENVLMKFALLLSTRSTCERLRVGCIITSNDFQKVYSYGYNGNAKGFYNGCDSLEPGKCGCIHAEANALIKCSIMDAQKIIFITQSPCKMCAKMIVNSGASHVYHFSNYRSDEGLEVLSRGNIKVSQIKLET
ncbi:MAG: deaminase [bacterium]|nr:deaminase [bacterium]